ncbi:unnamed protein product [Dracunculus medinensis]|uniref:SAM-dependent MTase TRM10-type domain-containing protein n=1 Tax=Dracunculus medinensis TaxID=318479 RepID=A0A0N4UL49_DRAME|nr:unnamed protein product [Dracunculus medinensis]
MFEGIEWRGEGDSQLPFDFVDELFDENSAKCALFNDETIAQFRRERRKEERVRRRKNKKLSNSITELKMDINIYIDFGFSYAMNDKEIKKLVRQMGRVWGLQKRNNRLKITLLSPCNRFLAESRREILCDKCIYLSPDADLLPLSAVSSDYIYIIGGLVDETGAGSLSRNKADALGIPAYRFPIVENMRKGVKGTFNLMLSINNVVEILIFYVLCGRWDKALGLTIPKKSGYLPIYDEKLSLVSQNSLILLYPA